MKALSIATVSGNGKMRWAQATYGGEADWSRRPATATRGPSWLAARTFVVTSLVQHLFVPRRLGKAPASTAQRVDANFEICMESSALHAYFERLVTTTSSTTCGSAKPTTLRRQKNRCAITIFLHRLCTPYYGLECTIGFWILEKEISRAPFFDSP